MKKVILFIFLTFITLKAGDLECKALYFKERYTRYEPDGSTKYGISNDYTESKYVPTSIEKSSTIVAEIYYEF